MKQNGLTKTQACVLLGAKGEARAAREERARSLLDGLAAEYKRVRVVPEGAQIGAVDQALLSAAASALLEIELTTARLVAGRAHSKALLRLGLARSELRRSLRALGLVADAGEARPDANAPPPNASAEERREWSQQYVTAALSEAAMK